MSEEKARQILAFLKRKYVIDILYALQPKRMSYSEIEKEVANTSKLYELLQLLRKHKLITKIVDDERNENVYIIIERGNQIIWFIDRLKQW